MNIWVAYRIFCFLEMGEGRYAARRSYLSFFPRDILHSDGGDSSAI